MTNVSFDDLIEKLPKIAEVVNSFTSQEVQKLAFSTILESLGVKAAARSQVDEATKEIVQQGSTDITPRGPTKMKKKRATKVIQADRKLNLRPQSTLSFADFVKQKNPTNNDEKNVVAVFYLINVLKQKTATLEQIVTCYEDRNWRIPNDIANSLQYTSSTKHWIDSRDRGAIELGIAGKNYVTHDMSSAEEDI